MASSIQFKLLNEAELENNFGKLKTLKADYPKTAVSTADLKSKLKDWQKKQAVEEETVKLLKIDATPLKADHVAKLRAISESATPTGEAVAGQKLTPEQVTSTLFISLATLEYTKKESEFKKKLAAARTASAKQQVEDEWGQGKKEFLKLYSAAGISGAKEADLDKYAQELNRSKANFNAIVKIANTATPSDTVKASAGLKAAFVPQTATLITEAAVSAAIPNLCSVPFKEGSFTKHFGRSFNLTVSIPYICFPHHWWLPEICHKHVVLAGASFSVDVSVGYRVTCCGASAWGRAGAQACATLLGKSFCAGCTATITGVAGIGRSGSGSSCTYGIGISAQLKCTFGGLTVLNVQAPFGFNVSGPCPPAGLC